MKIDLNGSWRLWYFPCEERVSSLAELSDKPCIDAAVPGNVELDLIRAGELPQDIFYADNIRKVRKYELYDFCYMREFDASDMPKGERAVLVFEAVDCLADYYLNGELIGSSENMFISHEFDVTSKLKDKNTIHVYIRSAVEAGMKYPYEVGMHSQLDQFEQLNIRKAGSSYGWDIFCRAVSAGIWRGVRLESRKTSRIEDIFFDIHDVSADEAAMRVIYNFDVEPKYFRYYDEASDDYLRMRCDLTFVSDDHVFEHSFKCNSSHGFCRMKMPNPKLWWPLGYGGQNLYDVTAKLYSGDGQLIDTWQKRIGVRSIELESSVKSGKDGKFVIKVNGEPIMCKGSNWVPLDPFHSRDAERYEKALELFTESGSNIVRCWGGNVYEDHKFFDICDEKGILVWQDFCMACAIHPQTEEFANKIRTEAISVVKKLRHHASLALWCGDNECDQLYFGAKIGDPNRNILTRKVLPEVLITYDPRRPYIPSSPYVSPENYQEVLNNGWDICPENHLWGPRNYFKSPIYTESNVNFISEMGYHGSNSIESLKKFIPEEHLWLGEDIIKDKYWLYHASCNDLDSPYNYRIKLMFEQIHAYFGVVPETLEDFVFMSQVSQAEAKKYFIERMRVKKWMTSGIIWWNMLDGWPQLSDAVVDYYFDKKLAFEYIRRVQRKVCVMFDEPRGWSLNAVIGNDSLEDFTVAYEITDADSGEVVLSGETLVPANENKQIGALRVSTGDQKMYVIKYTYDGRTEYNHYIHGTPPFSMEKYRSWLDILAKTDKKLERWAR